MQNYKKNLGNILRKTIGKILLSTMFNVTAYLVQQTLNYNILLK